MPKRSLAKQDLMMKKRVLVNKLPSNSYIFGGKGGQELLEKKFVSGNSSSRPDRCLLCEDIVPDLRSHVNALHLPPIIDPLSYCTLCRCQCNSLDQLLSHAQELHDGGIPGIMPNEFFNEVKDFIMKIMKSLSLKDINEVVTLAREAGMGTTEDAVPHQNVEGLYKGVFWGLDYKVPLQTSKLLNVRDITHWEIIYRLVVTVVHHVPPLDRKHWMTLGNSLYSKDQNEFMSWDNSIVQKLCSSEMKIKQFCHDFEMKIENLILLGSDGPYCRVSGENFPQMQYEMLIDKYGKPSKAEIETFLLRMDQNLRERNQSKHVQDVSNELLSDCTKTLFDVQESGTKMRNAIIHKVPAMQLENKQSPDEVLEEYVQTLKDSIAHKRASQEFVEECTRANVKRYITRGVNKQEKRADRRTDRRAIKGLLTNVGEASSQSSKPQGQNDNTSVIGLKNWKGKKYLRNKNGNNQNNSKRSNLRTNANKATGGKADVEKNLNIVIDEKAHVKNTDTRQVVQKSASKQAETSREASKCEKAEVKGGNLDLSKKEATVQSTSRTINLKSNGNALSTASSSSARGVMEVVGADEPLVKIRAKIAMMKEYNDLLAQRVALEEKLKQAGDPLEVTTAKDNQVTSSSGKLILKGGEQQKFSLLSSQRKTAKLLEKVGNTVDNKMMKGKTSKISNQDLNVGKSTVVNNKRKTPSFTVPLSSTQSRNNVPTSGNRNCDSRKSALCSSGLGKKSSLAAGKNESLSVTGQCTGILDRENNKAPASARSDKRSPLSQRDTRSPLRVRDGRRSPPRARGDRKSPLRIRDDRKSPLRIRDDRKSPLRTRDDRKSPLRTRDDRKSPFRARDDRKSLQWTRDDRKSPLRTRDDRKSPLRTRDGRKSPLRVRDGRKSPLRVRDDRKSPLRVQDDRRSPPWTRDDRRSPLRGRDDRRSPLRGRDGRRTPPRGRDGRRFSPRMRDDRRSPLRLHDGRWSPIRVRDDRRSPLRGRDSKRSPLRGHSDMSKRLPVHGRNDGKSPFPERFDRTLQGAGCSDGQLPLWKQASDGPRGQYMNPYAAPVMPLPRMDVVTDVVKSNQVPMLDHSSVLSTSLIAKMPPPPIFADDYRRATQRDAIPGFGGDDRPNIGEQKHGCDYLGSGFTSARIGSSEQRHVKDEELKRAAASFIQLNKEAAASPKPNKIQYPSQYYSTSLQPTFDNFKPNLPFYSQPSVNSNLSKSHLSSSFASTSVLGSGGSSGSDNFRELSKKVAELFPKKPSLQESLMEAEEKRKREETMSHSVDYSLSGPSNWESSYQSSIDAPNYRNNIGFDSVSDSFSVPASVSTPMASSTGIKGILKNRSPGYVAANQTDNIWVGNVTEPLESYEGSW